MPMPDPALHPDAPLIGRAGGARALSTPALVIDADALAANIASMARHVAAAGLALRPHAKTHKSAVIARAQREAGAVGICVAKLAEAEALALAGVTDILVTSPVVTPRAMARAAALAARGPGLILVVDTPGVAEALGQVCAGQGIRLDVLVDVNIGLGRTGLAPQEAAGLARAVSRMPGLRLRGLQAYGGHLMHLADRAERRTRSLAALAPVGELARALRAEGLDIGIVSGGGTGTFDIDPEAGVFTELQAGSYVFMDREYRDVWAGAPPPFAPALFVQTTVISANVHGLVTTDAGIKAFATDAGPPVLHAGAPEGAKYFLFGDEQGGVVLPQGGHLAVGDVLRCVVPHCDPTVNLYDWYHVVRGETLTALWPVDARGRSQ